MNLAIIAGAVGLLMLLVGRKSTGPPPPPNIPIGYYQPRPSRPVFKNQRTGGMRPGETNIKMVSDRSGEMPDKPLSQQQEGLARRGRM